MIQAFSADTICLCFYHTPAGEFILTVLAENFVSEPLLVSQKFPEFTVLKAYTPQTPCTVFDAGLCAITDRSDLDDRMRHAKVITRMLLHHGIYQLWQGGKLLQSIALQCSTVVKRSGDPQYNNFDYTAVLKGLFIPIGVTADEHPVRRVFANFHHRLMEAVKSGDLARISRLSNLLIALEAECPAEIAAEKAAWQPPTAPH